MKKLVEPSFGDIFVLAARLVDRLRADAKVTDHSIVIPVIRGGLIPGTIVSYALQIGLCQPVHAVSGNWASPRNDLIVIDDICDTGLTFRHIKARFPNAVYAALYAKPQGVDLCDYHCQLVPQDHWVVMPWAPNDEINR
jgi:xanthine phosphoribosyltransferase